MRHSCYFRLEVENINKFLCLIKFSAFLELFLVELFVLLCRDSCSFALQLRCNCCRIDGSLSFLSQDFEQFSEVCLIFAQFSGLQILKTLQNHSKLTTLGLNSSPNPIHKSNN
ncbi:hypothetical protein ACKWTF_000942 [Chironomus riparius]